MENRKPLLLAALILLVIIGVTAGYIYWNRTHPSNTLILYGNIDIRQVDLGFRVFGKLKSVNYEEGDQVFKGDLLAELDNAPYVQNLKESEARIASLKENLAYANAQLKRRTSLVQGKSVSEEDYQQSYYNQKTLEANLREAEAALQNAKIRLEDTKLLAPSDGVVYTRIREPGTILNTGEPVFSVAVIAPIWARTYISEPDLGKIYPGMRAKIHTDTPENPIYEGHIGFISPIAEFTPKNVEAPDLRTNLVYQLRVIIDNPNQGLRQGMPVTVELEGPFR
jgi:HlyD family secretion protein